MRAFELVRRAVACLPLLTFLASAPVVAQTKTFSDPAVPVGIVSEPFFSIVDVLNKDRTLTQYATQSISNAGYSCAPAPGLAAQSSTPHILAYDSDLFEIGPASSGSSIAIAPITSPYYNGCSYGPLTMLPGTVTSVLATAGDNRRQRLFVLASSGGSSPETVIGYDASTFTYNNASALVSYGAANLDTGATYTAMVTDIDGAYGDTAITELRTSTTAGNLWIYSTAGRAVKVLAPDGSSLPAINAFIIHNPNDLGGELLVLVNQDGLTATNQTNPPLDATAFTLIDLGQLHQLIAASPGAATVTLPAVSKIAATTPYYAMLGAAWNPVNKLLYAVVGGGDASGNVFRHVLSYDPYHPSAPAETLVADVTAVPIIPPAYPQVALNAAAGSMQFLTQNPTAAYTVSLTSGATATATQLGAATFASDPGFAPTAMTVNPLAGNTWFVSSSGKVDALTLPSNGLVQPYLDFTDPEVVANTGNNSVHVLGFFPYNSDFSLYSINVTVTATKQGGTPYTFGTALASDVRVNGTDISGNFPSAGIYTLTANFPGDSNQAAFTSSPVVVYVATPPFTPALAVTAKAATGTTGSASVTLTGSSWVPTGTINIVDASSNAVLGTYTLSGPLSNPISIPITFPASTTRVVASYLGDTQNALATSASAPIVSSVAAPTLTLGNIASVVLAATSNNGTVTFGATTTTAPTGTVTIYYVPSGGTTQTVLTYVSAASAFSASGAGFTYASPADPGNYTLYASYPGDSNYSAVTSAGTPLTVLVAIDTTTTVTAPATAAVNGLFSVNIKLASATSTQTPSGTINVFAKLAGATTSTNIGIVNASQAYSAAGNSFNASFPTAGVWTITASFYGDPYFRPSTGTTTITVNPSAAVATTLKISAPANVATNTPYTAVVALTAASALTNGPSGLVTIVVTSPSGAVVSTINTTAASAFLGSGYSASIPAATASGTYTLTATYAGDSNYAASTSSLAVSVTGGATPTTLGLSAPSNPTAGTSFITTVTLKATGSPTAAITGTVTLMAVGSGGTVNSYSLGTMPASAALASGGVQITASIPAAGTYTLTALYAGDANYLTSSGSALITVARLQTTIITSSASLSVTVGTPIDIFTELLLAPNAATLPTGTFTITATLAGTVVATTSVTPADARLGAPLFFTPAKPGLYSTTASYSGDSLYLPSTSTTNVTVSALPTPQISITAPPYGVVSKPVPIAIKLTDANGKPLVSTGLVTITSTTNGLSGPSTAVAASAGSAALTFPTAGVYLLFVTFAGDANYGPAAPGSSQGSLTIYTGQPSFTLQPVDPALNQNGPPVLLTRANLTEGFVLTSVNGYSGSPVITTSEKTLADGGTLNGVLSLGIADTSFVTSIFDQSGALIGYQSANVSLSSPSTPFGIEFFWGQDIARNKTSHTSRGPVMCALLGAIALAGLRRRKRFHGIARLLCLMLMTGSAATLLTGCYNIPATYLVTVTATDATYGITQTTSFQVTVTQ